MLRSLRSKRLEAQQREARLPILRDAPSALLRMRALDLPVPHTEVRSTGARREARGSKKWHGKYPRCSSLASHEGLDQRCRDLDGEIRQKRGDTLVRTLRDTYGSDFASGVRSDTRLDTLRSVRASHFRRC